MQKVSRQAKSHQSEKEDYPPEPPSRLSQTHSVAVVAVAVAVANGNILGPVANVANPL